MNKINYLLRKTGFQIIIAKKRRLSYWFKSAKERIMCYILGINIYTPTCSHDWGDEKAIETDHNGKRCIITILRCKKCHRKKRKIDWVE